MQILAGSACAEPLGAALPSAAPAHLRPRCVLRLRFTLPCRRHTAPGLPVCSSTLASRVLGPCPPDQHWWDSKIFSYPLVVRTDEEQAIEGKYPWRMYYYGRDVDAWRQGINLPFPNTPLGRVGLAVSGDGLSWERFRGHLPAGAILDPSEDPQAFDCAQVGLGEVLPGKEEKIWRMFYMGGGHDSIEVPGSGQVIKGVKSRIGMAVSDDGIAFRRHGSLLLDVGNVGEFDENSVGFPRVLPPAPDGPQRWLMTYHTLNFTRGFVIGVATSVDGATWQKEGQALHGGPAGSWDMNGVMTRCVLRLGGKFVMFYEGARQPSRYAIGIATSEDGIVWEKDSEVGPEPGGPIFSARMEDDAWDNLSVGTPNVVAMPDGTFRLYYTGQGRLKSGEQTRGIGVALSDGTNFRSWHRLESGC